EYDSSDDENFIELRISVQVDTLVISPWHKRNQSFIKSLGMFISTDRRFENESYGLLMAAIQQATPQSEKILIEPTVEFFKKQFGKPDLEKTKKGNPLRAKLIIIENDDIDQNK
ncbi:hypothetical protein EA003_21345, partial [Vibrio anguillarum]|nr:hypothetical protein [Vibrio anguillarum]